MSFASVASAVISVGGGLIEQNQAKKAAESANKGVPYTPVNVDDVITQARGAAAQNYQDSLNLEQTYNPTEAAFRSNATQLAQNLAAGNTPGMQARNAILPAVTSIDNPLLTQSADSIMKQLKLGSALPTDVQNQVVRAALSGSGQSGLAGSYAARGLTAQDIGTTSLALLNQRQQAAQGAGSLLEQLGLARLQGANAAAGTDASTALGLKNLSDAFALPTSGLSPGSIASLYVGNSNAQNQVNAQNAQINQQNSNAKNQQLTQLLGFGSSALSGSGAYGKIGSGLGSLFSGGGGTGGTDFFAGDASFTPDLSGATSFAGY